jgi:hypothetical protein
MNRAARVQQPDNHGTTRQADPRLHGLMLQNQGTARGLPAICEQAATQQHLRDARRKDLRERQSLPHLENCKPWPTAGALTLPSRPACKPNEAKGKNLMREMPRSAIRQRMLLATNA